MIANIVTEVGMKLLHARFFGISFLCLSAHQYEDAGSVPRELTFCL